MSTCCLIRFYTFNNELIFKVYMRFNVTCKIEYLWRPYICIWVRNTWVDTLKKYIHQRCECIPCYFISYLIICLFCLFFPTNPVQQSESFFVAKTHNLVSNVAESCYTMRLGTMAVRNGSNNFTATNDLLYDIRLYVVYLIISWMGESNITSRLLWLQLVSYWSASSR